MIQIEYILQKLEILGYGDVEEEAREETTEARIAGCLNAI